MGMDDDVGTRCQGQDLILGLGFPPAPGTPSKISPGPHNGFDIDPCLTLALSHGSSFNEESGGGCGKEASSSSFSGEKAVKREREREASSDEDEDLDLGEGGNTLRKKLRLNKDQSVVLEESFKQHITLNPKQKQALARQLNLRPRQVEVWFQNRRARTKLKQTEVECELLKKSCETLSDENRRLKKELKALKSAHAQPLVTMHVGGAVTTLAMCPSCGVGDDMSQTQTTHPHFYAPPAATC